MSYARILSSGIYVPSETMSNEEFEEKVGHQIDPYYSENLGINHRHISSEEETPSYMAARAVEEALDNANINPNDLDLLILGTDTPEAVSPPTSTKVQYEIGAHEEEVPTFDVNASCANDGLMLDIASKYIESGRYDNIMVVGTYAMTKFLSWKYQWEALFSDGAGAILLTSSDEKGYIGGVGRSDGSYWNNWGIYMGAGNMDIEGINEGLHKLDLRKKFPSTVNEEGWPILINQMIDKFDFEKEDIGMTFFTQVRKKSIEEVMDKVDLPMDKTHMTMMKFGYSGSACAYQAFHDAAQSGKMEGLEGDVVLFITSGVGYQQYGSAFKWV